MRLMGLDIGTTGVKAAVFSPEGQTLGYGFEEYSVCCPRPGYAEQDAEAVFQAALRVMAVAAKPVGGDISAIGLSVQGDAVVAVDENYKPVAPVQLGMDYRCRAQADAFEREFGARKLFDLTGMVPHPLNSLCKIRNFVETAPETDKKARRYMTYSDYVLSRLGADEPVIDRSMATRTMGVSLAAMDWQDALIEKAGVTRGKLSSIVPSGVVVGTLSRELCSPTGIGYGAKLVTGGHDQVCAAFGAGVIKPDMALDSHGTAEVVSTVLPKPMTNDTMFKCGFPCYSHAVPGAFFTFSLNHTAGIALKWFVEGFCESDRDKARKDGVSPYAYVLERAADAPSSVMALAYLGGKGTPDWNLAAKGLIAGLTLSTTRYDVARAVLEALCFDMRENIEALRASGINIDSLRCVGGGAKSPIGLQLKADVTGLEVKTLEVREAACLGAALLAGMALGEYKNETEAASVVRLEKTFEPRAEQSRFYAERYAVYRELYAANRASMEKL